MFFGLHEIIFIEYANFLTYGVCLFLGPMHFPYFYWERIVILNFFVKGANGFLSSIGVFEIFCNFFINITDILMNQPYVIIEKMGSLLGC